MSFPIILINRFRGKIIFISWSNYYPHWFSTEPRKLMEHKIQKNVIKEGRTSATRHVLLFTLWYSIRQQHWKSPRRNSPAGTLLKNGGDLLSHFRSTIGAAGLNFSVRNGKRWDPSAVGHLNRVWQTSYRISTHSTRNTFTFLSRIDNLRDSQVRTHYSDARLRKVSGY